MGLLDKIRGWFSNQTKNARIAQEMNVTFRLPPDMTELIESWRDTYMGFYSNSKLESSGVGSMIANDLAKKACSELIVTATLGESTDFDISQTFNNSMMLDIRQEVEYALALGGVVCRPYFDGNRICYTWYTADKVLPTNWAGRRLTGCILLDYYEKADNGNASVIYTKLESHGIDMTDGKWHIRTKLFKNFTYSGDNYMGQAVPLSEISEWADIEPDIIIEQLETPTFCYIGCPNSNNKALNLPCGVSIFKDSMPWIKAFDEALESILWEARAGRTKIFVGSSMIPQKRYPGANGGKSVIVDDLGAFDKLLYKKLDNEGLGQLFEQWAPNLRFDSIISYMKFLLHNICILSGLDPSSFVFDEGSYAVTAREIISKQQKTYHTICDIQRYMIVPLINQIVDTTRQLQMLYRLPNILPKELKINCDFGDSILIDELQEKQDALAEVQNGLRSKLSYLMVVRKLSEADALEELKRISSDGSSFEVVEDAE